LRITQYRLALASIAAVALLYAVAACTGDDPAATLPDDAGAITSDAPSADADAGGTGDAFVDGAPSRQFSSVAMGEVSACAIAKDGSTWCWGANAFGGLGDPNLDAMRARAARVIMPPAAAFVSIASGYSHTCGLTADGAVWCWGLNNHGQLGHDPATDPTCTGALRCSAKPQQVLGLVASTVVGLEFATCALATTGDAYCWGFGEDGILGEAKADGGAPTAGSESFAPVKILGLPAAQVKALGAARWPGHTACVALASGEVRCWGENPWGGLGHLPGADGDRTAAALPHCNPCNPVPTIVRKTLADGGKTPLSDVRAVVGGYTSCALVGASQNLDCWGANFCSQIGSMDPEAGAGTFSAEPHRRVDDAVSSIGVGDFMCARLLNGQVKCWGSDGTGVVGAAVDGGTCNTDDGIVAPAAPTPRAQDVIVDSMDVGHFAVAAVDQEGHVVAWGRNEFGQLGHAVGKNGDDPQQHDRNITPQRVQGLDDP
jgi:alpha-tubulin suppressor-like RCC1 family protein